MLQVFEPLLDYIAHNMGKLGEALLTPNFIQYVTIIFCLAIPFYDKGVHLDGKHKGHPLIFRQYIDIRILTLSASV